MPACDRCGEEIDGLTFGRRVTENWCWRCWFAHHDEQDDARERKRQEEIQMTDNEISVLRNSVAWAKGDVQTAEKKLENVRASLVATEERLAEAVRRRENLDRPRKAVAA